ncbi:Guanylate-binding protein 1 [Bagarius yarrelli]|uniref:Guanylate-binding protein 1 n=1 Tax=Bagarius yarrelli TaxID=175774 RepID=A0A556VBK5_BAGYA|nr:Guanylate-binding protein 1 [Bagarius yarrelli]
MCNPMPEPICLVENVNGSLCVNEKAIKYLSRNNQPVVVVSVVGLYRTGKSYLLNRLAGKPTGFALGSTIESKTKGIWMWCMPHPNNAEQSLVLLDTEGLGDIDKGDSKNDAWIFCLAVLLSSTLVYNSRGTIDNQAVENLHYVSELAKQIKIKSPAASANEAEEEEEEEEKDEESQFVQFFPNFIWAVRDFSLELVIEKRGQVTEDDYLDFALQLKKGLKYTHYNLPRECIRHYFPSRKCFVFPMPASQDTFVQLENLHESELLPKFLDVTQHFRDYVFDASKIKTLKGGYQVTGRKEKEQAELLRQQCKAEEQRKQEMEQLMKEEKDHYQQRIQQLEKKFKEEQFLQQLELERALESKLNEQKQLVEKGFNEKSKQMEQEIEQLKREKEKQSYNVLSDLIMPLVDTAANVLSTVLQYKLTRKGLPNVIQP